jgi:hypothetical protein
MPLTISDVKSDKFGDGIMIALDDGYVFETDNGAAVHTYPWDTVRAYNFDADTGELLLKLRPMFGTAIYVKSPHAPEAWRSLLNQHGVIETDNPAG